MLFDETTIDDADEGDVERPDDELSRGPRRLQARSGRYAFRRVLEGGLAHGVTRASICVRPFVTKVRTIDLDPDSVDRWRRNRARPRSLYVDSEETADRTVEVGDVFARIAAEADSVENRPPGSPARQYRTFDTLFLDVVGYYGDGWSAYRDPEFRRNLRRVFRDHGDRVLVLLPSDRDPKVSGFVWSEVDRDDSLGWSLYLAIRFSPAEGIGEDPRAGLRFAPGFGWVPIEEVL